MPVWRTTHAPTVHPAASHYCSIILIAHSRPLTHHQEFVAPILNPNTPASHGTLPSSRRHGRYRQAFRHSRPLPRRHSPRVRPHTVQTPLIRPVITQLRGRGGLHHSSKLQPLLPSRQRRLRSLHDRRPRPASQHAHLLQPRQAPRSRNARARR